MLTVVIPAYNRERTIAAAVHSALGCGAAVAVVVVDDGSADGTAAAAAVDPRVTVVRQANGGPAAARNTGFARAATEYVAFLDSDDRWHPGVVAAVLAALGAHPELTGILCETLVGDPAGGYEPISQTTGRGRFAELLTDPIGPDLFRLDRWLFVRRMLDRNQIFLGSLIVRRAACPADGPFDPDLFGGEDYEFALRLAAAGGLGYFARPLAIYEKHAGGLSADPDRMSREFAKAVAAFVGKTPGLPPAVAAVARRHLAGLRFGYGYRLYDRGKLAEARTWFAQAARGGHAAAAAYWLVCGLPAGWVRRARRLKRAGG